MTADRAQRIRQACNPISGLRSAEFERHVQAIIDHVDRIERRRVHSRHAESEVEGAAAQILRPGPGRQDQQSVSEKARPERPSV